MCADSVPGYLKFGSSFSNDGETFVKWAIYDRAAVEKAWGCSVEEDTRDVARFLTGWARYSNGPGRWFGYDPCFKVYRHKVLVYQRSALDI